MKLNEKRECSNCRRSYFGCYYRFEVYDIQTSIYCLNCRHYLDDIRSDELACVSCDGKAGKIDDFYEIIKYKN